MPAPSSSLISTTADLKLLLSSIIWPDSTIYLDLEGKKLGRHGTLTLATMLIHPRDVLCVVDVLTLGESAFNIEAENGKSLKSILEDPEIPKCVWDVRNDADALWAHFQVKLAGVVDVQLLENASRPARVDKARLSGLDNAVRYDLKLGFMGRERWIRTKNDVRSRMSQDIFSSRPLAPDTLQYCINDVVHLPALRKHYMERITPDWLAKSREESSRRVADAWSPGYQPQSPEKVFSPWRKTGSATTLTVEEALELWQMDQHDLEEEYDYFEDERFCSADADFDGTFDSCWEKN